MTTIEILQAAIDEGCEIGIYRTSWNDVTVIHVDIEGKKTFGWAVEPTLEESIATAWKTYQTNKNQ